MKINIKNAKVFNLKDFHEKQFIDNYKYVFIGSYNGDSFNSELVLG